MKRRRDILVTDRTITKLGFRLLILILSDTMKHQRDGQTNVVSYNSEAVSNKSGMLILGGVGVQGQGKGQRLMSNIAVNDCIWLATCQGRIYEK